MFVMRLHALILENELLLWTEEMKQMLGFSWHPAEEKRSFHLSRQVSGKSKRNIGQSGVCVCALTARGLDMRSKDWRMRLAVALVTPQG